MSKTIEKTILPNSEADVKMHWVDGIFMVLGSVFAFLLVFPFLVFILIIFLDFLGFVYS